METLFKITPCEPKDLTNEQLPDLVKPIHDLPLRERELSTPVKTDPYDTFFNGLMVDMDSYGILGYMIFNRSDIKVFGNDNIFITSEPRNLAPLEALVVYRSNGLPYFTVYDWGKSSLGYHHISVLDDAFFNKYHHTVTTPNGEGVHALVFQNFFNFEKNCNQVLLMNNSKKWELIYESKTLGLPALATGSSGWSVFEFKKHKTNVSPLPKVPFMLGTMGLKIMDNKGDWSKLNGRIREDNTNYVRVFANASASAYKSK